MSHGKRQEERSTEQEEEMGEETFLKDLYLYMKNRNTPIERIPHLGFKQIDLFLMYKTVKSLDGYHQVTSQQLWKQVYNTLGGNPRSTSAATCTRRHYEKLLLPFECHLKGGDYMEVIPQRQQKRTYYNSEEEDCPRGAKRSMSYRPHHTSLHQNFLTDSCMRILPMPAHYHQYCHHRHPALPPYVPSCPTLTTNGHSIPHPAPHHQVPYLASSEGSIERAKQPLERLRYLADRFKSSSGRAEPLNLSCKATAPESASHPASSFAPLPSKKTPKFLNKASTLYPAKGVTNNEGCETLEGEAAPRKLSPAPAFNYPPVAREGCVIDLTSSSTWSSQSSTPASAESPSPPSLHSRRESTPAMVQIPRALTMEYPDWSREGREENHKTSPGPLNLSRALPSPPRESGGRMEIQIPLTVLHDWIKGGLLSGPTASRPGPLSFQHTPGPTPGKEPRERDSAILDSSSSSRDDLANLNFHNHHRGQDRSGTMVDLSLRERSLERHRNLPSPTIAPISDLHPKSPYRYSSCRPLPVGSIPQHVDSREVYPWKEQEARRFYYTRSMNGQDPQDRGSSSGQVLPIPKIHSSPQSLELDNTGPKSPTYSPDISQGRMERSGLGGHAVLMVNLFSLSDAPDH